jgi:hypothetical protein
MAEPEIRPTLARNVLVKAMSFLHRRCSQPREACRHSSDPALVMTRKLASALPCHTAVPEIDMVKIMIQRVYQVEGSSDAPQKKKIHRQLTGVERNPNRSGVLIRTSMLRCATC